MHNIGIEQDAKKTRASHAGRYGSNLGMKLK